MNTRIIALFAGLLAVLPMTSAWANSFTATPTLTGASNPTGAGLVYVSASSADDAKTSGKTSVQGSQSSNDNGDAFTMTLYASASPNEGYEFVDWTGATRSNGQSCEVDFAVSSSSKSPSKTVTANFRKRTYDAFKVTFDAPVGGTIEVSDDSDHSGMDAISACSYNQVVKLTLKAVELEKYAFTGWYAKDAAGNETSLGTDAQTTYSTTASVTLGAHFVFAGNPIVNGENTYDDFTLALSEAKAGDSIVVINNFTTDADLTIPEGVTVTVNKGKTLTLNGTVMVKGSLVNNGAIAGSGTLHQVYFKILQTGRDGVNDGPVVTDTLNPDDAKTYFVTKAKKDPNKPKRPPSAFFVFLEEFRKTFKAENPHVKAVSAVGKAGGEKWKSMSPAEKATYEAKAQKRKADYEKQMNAYNKKAGKFSR